MHHYITLTINGCGFNDYKRDPRDRPVMNYSCIPQDRTTYVFKTPFKTIKMIIEISTVQKAFIIFQDLQVQI